MGASIRYVSDATWGGATPGSIPTHWSSYITGTSGAAFYPDVRETVLMRLQRLNRNYGTLRSSHLIYELRGIYPDAH